MADVRIEGLRELRAALKATDKTLPRDLNRSLKTNVADPVARKAAAGVPRLSGRAAASLRPGATARGAYIKGGGARAPHYPWLDFGGRVGIRNSISRPRAPEGRYLFPTISAERDNIRRATEQVVNKALSYFH